MNKLTTESARQELTKLKVWENDGVLTLKEERYMQALEIALPILEQQEQKQEVGVREGLAALSAHIDSIGGYNFEALEAYRREELGQQEPVEYRVIRCDGGVAAHCATLEEATATVSKWNAGWHVQPVFLQAAPPAPVKLPDVMDGSILGKNDSYIDKCQGWNACRAEVLRLNAIDNTAQQYEALAGWKVVPIEPTWEMLAADGCSKHHEGQECSHHETRKRIWRAMLEASPVITDNEVGNA